LDDDHVGSLKTLVYYRYFIFGKTTNLVFHEKIRLKEYMNIQGEFNTVDGKPNKIVEHNPIDSKTILNGIEIIPVKTKHHIPCYGAIFNKKVFISADTVAIKEIEETVEEVMGFDKNKLYFHDFNFYQQSSHATKENIEETYKKEFIDMLKFYHNDKNELEGKEFTI